MSMDTTNLFKYFPEFSDKQKDQYNQLKALYLDWNSKINVISRKDMEHFYEHHVLHSLAIAKYYELLPGMKVMDLGTGGGFPGIPLAIMFPQTEFYLIDGTGKKIKVVNAVKDAIGLENVVAEQKRAEERIYVRRLIKVDSPLELQYKMMLLKLVDKSQFSETMTDEYAKAIDEAKELLGLKFKGNLLFQTTAIAPIEGETVVP